MSKKQFRTNDKNLDVSFSSTFLVLSRFRVFLSEGSSKAVQKTFCEKNVSKRLYKRPSLKVVLRFGRGASQKKEKENKHEKKNLAKSDRPTFPFFFFFFRCPF
jgi:hypothetical protein